MNNTKQKETWIIVLKFVACLMITNSHCRDIYPISYLAVGGGFGNSLFFIISGYLLVNINGDFGSWIRKRYTRVVPITLFFVVLNEIILRGDNILSLDAIGFVNYYINKYWFVFAIMLYYIVYFFVFRGSSRRKYLALLVWGVMYCVFYVFLLDKTTFSVELGGASPFKVYYYFGIMIMGGILRENKETIMRIISGKHRQICILLIILAAMLGWAGEYALITLFGVALQVQFLIHLFVFVFAVFCVLFAWTIPFRENPLVEKIANSTLEIYLVQATYLSIKTSFDFPINWFMFWGVAIIGGAVVHLIVEKRSEKK